MIVVKNLTKIYNSKTKNKDEEVIALNKINLVLPDKGFIAVYGASGCGKSTLLNYILNNQKGYKVAVIVNDIGEVNIDATLIEKGAGIVEEDKGSVVFSTG